VTDFPEIDAVLAGQSEGAVVCADCLDVLPTLPDGCVDLIAVDPPYFKVKNAAWDRQWDTATGFLAWMAGLRDEWFRLLKPNGSLYCFASPRMAARVECCIAERFNVLNRITWRKHDGSYNEGGMWSWANKDSLRRFFEQKEEIIFAEHYGADNAAKGEAGYGAKCDELRGFVFEPLRAYIDGEWARAGLRRAEANVACDTASMAERHFFARSQYRLPTHEHYMRLWAYANQHGRQPAPPWEEYHEAPPERFGHDGGGEYLRADYENLRADYENLRRPFAVTADVPYTDVWDFPTVQAYKGKHPCEKPLAMMGHIVRSSTRENAVVLDCFAGSGAMLHAAHNLGRRYIGIELDETWAARARARLAATPRPLFTPEQARKPDKPLFPAAGGA